MAGTRIWAMAIVAGLAACSPDDQTPFETDPTTEVSKEIGNEGGIISTPAGVALRVPAGGLNGVETLVISPGVPMPTNSAPTGVALNSNGFGFQPMGLTFATEARIEITTGDLGNDPRAALAPSSAGGALANQVSFAESSGPASKLGYFLFIDTGNGFQVIPSISLDIDRGTISAWIRRLGNIAVGYTNPLTLKPGTEHGATGGAIQAGDYTLECGLLQDACIGGTGAAPIQIYTDAEVISRYPNIGAVVESVQGRLTFDTQSRSVTGSAVINGVVQVVTGGTVTSKSIEIEISSGQGSDIEFPRGVTYQTSGKTISFETSSGQQSFDYTATASHLELTLSEITIPLTDSNGVERDHPISLVLRLQKSTGN